MIKGKGDNPMMQIKTPNSTESLQKMLTQIDQLLQRMQIKYGQPKTLTPMERYRLDAEIRDIAKQRTNSVR